MSQAKVDRYKEQKKNRKEIMKKEKREWLLTKLGVSAVGLALAAWIGISVANGFIEPDTTTPEVKSYTVNTSALDDFVDGLELE